MLKELRRRVRQFVRGAVQEALGEVEQRAHLLQTQSRLDLRDEVRYESGLLKALMYQEREFERLRDASFRVFSQFGEDGVIQYLLGKVPIENDLFIEIGVEDYRQSNTRFLLQKDDWRGVVVDCGPDARRFLQESGLYGWHTVDAVEAFVTAENINDLLCPYAGDIGLLSIDVDGVDYYLWKALDVVSPRIVIVEYQTNWGPTESVATPYRPDFDRTRHHFTNQAAGASLAALKLLADRKGYALVGSSDGPNAFFVRRDMMGALREATVEETYRALRYRDSRDESSRPTYLSTIEERRRAMRDAEIVDTETGRLCTVGELFGV